MLKLLLDDDKFPLHNKEMVVCKINLSLKKGRPLDFQGGRVGLDFQGAHAFAGSKANIRTQKTPHPQPMFFVQENHLGSTSMVTFPLVL